jgi:6-pyruvoyltetrahydropterin/6-carboxytetrahydropterin synthase
VICEVAREVEFDAGHRVPYHASKCFNPHGHRYRVRATVRGDVREDHGPEHGMVVDFGVLKALMVEAIHDRYDHSMIVWDHDDELLDALRGRGWSLVVEPVVPTAENLARLCFGFLEDALRGHPRLTLQAVDVWETPTCVATYRG